MFKNKSFESYRDLIFGAFMLVFSTVYLYLATGIRIIKGAILRGGQFIPLVLGISMIIVSIFILIEGYMKYKKSDKKENYSESNNFQKVLLILAIFVVYILGIGFIGFYVSSVVFLFTLITVLSDKEDRKHTKTIIISVISCVVIYLLFTRGFGMVLPTGLLF